MKSRLIYWLTCAGTWLLVLSSFRALYVLSDGFYFLMHRIMYHQRRVVRNNLCNASPKKSEAELREIERELYRHICDYALGEVKVLRMSFKRLHCRIEYDNKEESLAMIERHSGVVLLIPHYASFERTIGMGAIMQEGDIPVQIYKPSHSRCMDTMFKRIHARPSGYSMSKHSVAREIIRLCRNSKRVAVGMITDQSPNISEAHHWTTFLNQDADFMDGAERVAKLTDFPVFYYELKRQRRGYCGVKFDLITETPKEAANGGITELFAQRLEQTTCKEPAYWFWSYKRWKLKCKDVAWHERDGCCHIELKRL